MTDVRNKASVPKGEVVEGVVCQSSDLKENEMKTFEIGREGHQVLLIKQFGKLHAIGSKCSHYGAPLVNGALGKGRVRCPWHGACFNISTGDIEDFPGLDSIPRYECEVIAGGGIKVSAQKSQLLQSTRNKLACMAERDSKVTSTFVIIGAGAAGNNCAETLRTEGFQGRIVLVSGEKYLPYDRIKLSKVLNTTVDAITLRSQQFYKDAGIELLLNTRATKLKTDERMILLSNGSSLEYNKVFLAPGSRGRMVKYPGSDVANIFTLRDFDEGKALYSKFSSDKNLVIIGSSFIGMEVASYAIDKLKTVTVVGRSSVPFEQILGDLIGNRLQKMFLMKGVHFEMNNTVHKYVGKDGVVTEVHLSNGKRLNADIVLVAMGSDHNTQFLAGSELILNLDGSIPVDRFLETNVKGVYAGGDVAYAPVFVNDDKLSTIGHWGLAHYHGYIAALNMIGKARVLQSVPFFWTVLLGKSLRMAGLPGKYDSIEITGSLEDLKFVAYYCEGDVVNAVLTCAQDPIAACFAELLAGNKKLHKASVTKQKVEWFEKPLYS